MQLNLLNFLPISELNYLFRPKIKPNGVGKLLKLEFYLNSTWSLKKHTKLHILFIWKIVLRLTTAYIIPGSANLLVLCYP